MLKMSATPTEDGGNTLVPDVGESMHFRDLFTHLLRGAESFLRT